MLDRFGVNIAAFPELADVQGDACAPLTTALPGSEVVFNFASLRLNVSLPQVAMQNSVRGYIPPEQWDDGIPAALLNYSFTGNRGSDDDSYYLNLQSGLNYAWRLRNNGAWRYSQNNGERHSNWENIGTWPSAALFLLKASWCWVTAIPVTTCLIASVFAAGGSTLLTACIRTAFRATRPPCAVSPVHLPKWSFARTGT
jgi:outer membrane usher protein